MGLFEQMVQRNMQDTYNPQKVELLQNRMNTLEGSTMSPGRKARLMGEAARGLGALGEQVDFSKFSGLSPGNLSPGRADHLNAMQMGMQMNNMDFNAKREMEDARMASSVYNNRFARGGMLPKRRGLYLADGTARISDAQAAADADRICKTYGVCDPKPAPAPAPQAAPQPAPRVAPQPQKPNPFGGLLGKMVDAVNGSRKQLEDVNNYAQGGLLPDITKPFRKLGDAAGRVVDHVRQGAETIRQATPRQRAETASEGLGGAAGEAAEQLRNREWAVQQQLRDAEGYASGGIVRGPGGPTDDEVPMEIGGVPVNLSDQEAVLPAKTVRALGGAKAVERLIEMTNGKPPVEGGLRAGGRYSQGARPLSDEEKAVISATYAGGRPTDEGAYPVPNNTGRYGQSLAMQDALKMGAETSAALASRAGNFASEKIRKAGEPIPASPAPTPVEKPGLLESGVKTAVGTAALPFAALTDGVMNLAASAVGAERPEPDKYTAAADTMSREGISGLGLTTAGSVDGVKKGVADVMGWKPVATEAKRPEPAKEVPAPQAAPVTPEQAAAEAARQNAMSIADVNKRGFDKAVDTWNMQRDYGFADGPDVMANTNQNLRAMAENKPLMHNTMGEGIGRMDEWNRIQDKAGTGIRAQAIVGKDGRKQVMFSDSGVVKPQYIGADGQPTNEWNKTTAYREATARAASDKQTAADIEAKRELEHNWGPKMGGLLHRALRNQEAAAQAKNALSPMDRFNMEKGVAEFNRNVKNDEFNRTKATAEHEAKLDDTYDKSVKTAAQMYGEKEAPQTEAALRRYIDFNAKRAGKPPREFAAEAIENFHLEKALDTGQRWNVIDKPWDGVTNSRWKYVGDSTGLADMFNGIGGDHRFVDESTGRTIGYRDIKKMPEAHQKIFLGTKVIDGNGNPINMWTRMQKGK